MPELPEVETVRRDLEPRLSGRQVASVEVGRARAVRRHDDIADLVGRLEGRTVASVDRRGKFLLVRLRGGDVVVVHLGMSGQLLWVDDPGAAKLRHTHVVLGFGPPGPPAELRFVDPRTFGQVFLTSADVPELAHFGLDPTDPSTTVERLGSVLLTRRTRLKPLLLDQRTVAGIGNLYADEILHAARLHPDRPAASLTDGEVARLHVAMTATLAEAIERRGSSLADEQYRDLFGRVGGYQQHHQVYAREGKPCVRCGTPITRLRWSGRSTFLCTTCQPPSTGTLGTVVGPPTGTALGTVVGPAAGDHPPPVGSGSLPSA